MDGGMDECVGACVNIFWSYSLSHSETVTTRSCSPLWESLLLVHICLVGCSCVFCFCEVHRSHWMLFKENNKNHSSAKYVMMNDSVLVGKLL